MTTRLTNWTPSFSKSGTPFVYIFSASMDFMNSAFDLDAAAGDEKKAAALSFKLTLWKPNCLEQHKKEDGDATEKDKDGRVPGYRVDRRGLVRARVQESLSNVRTSQKFTTEWNLANIAGSVWTWRDVLNELFAGRQSVPRGPRSPWKSSQRWARRKRNWKPSGRSSGELGFCLQCSV